MVKKRDFYALHSVREIAFLLAGLLFLIRILPFFLLPVRFFFCNQSKSFLIGFKFIIIRIFMALGDSCCGRKERND